MTNIKDEFGSRDLNVTLYSVTFVPLVICFMLFGIFYNLACQSAILVAHLSKAM